ncbi:MAG TPA: response regulator transcription factor [Thermomicrobiales bacterium]|jgi:DNA-binding NarL/FixJ family response regulator|nr:response regulator transcription factor [Thermomicrobiales bacterium]
MFKRRILIVDDHPFFRMGLRRILEEESRITIVGEASSGHQALHQAEVLRPDLVLMDVQLPGITGIQIASALRRLAPNIAIVFLSMYSDEERLFAAIRAGALGFLTKDTDGATLLESIMAVLRGENLLHQAVLESPVLARRVLSEFRSMSQGAEPTETEVSLSPRELEVLDCLIMGNSNKEIAARLFITEQTVKNHMTSVLRKLQVDDRVAALRYAVTRGWAEIGPQPYAAVSPVGETTGQPV